MVFTFTSLPLNFCTSVSGCGCGFGFEQIYRRIDGFGEKKRHGSANLHIPIQPPLCNKCLLLLGSLGDLVIIERRLHHKAGNKFLSFLDLGVF